MFSVTGDRLTLFGLQDIKRIVEKGKIYNINYGHKPIKKYF